MNKCYVVSESTASPARANGGYTKRGQLRDEVSEANHVNLRGQNRDSKRGQGPGHVTTCSSTVVPRSHQRRWSDDYCRCGTPTVIAVKKNKKEPPPPQRGVSLLRPHAASQDSLKRYSCPAIGAFGSPTRLSSSSSSSSTSSCSSPPPVQTSVITGRDPLGWKMRPKSSSRRARSNRLSLQIPLPVVFPEPGSRPATDSQSVNTVNPEASPKTRPPLRPKPSWRRHSDSSAFLRSLATPLPVVTLEELCAMHLRPLTLSDESDDVFGGGDDKEAKVNMPPPVPEKTAMARQIAQLMAHSQRRRGPGTANAEIIYASVTKLKAQRSCQTEDHSSQNAGITAGLHVDSGCDRERTTPRFPG